MSITFPHNQNAISAFHALSGVDTTEIEVDKGFSTWTNEPFYRSYINPGFRADINNVNISAVFNGKLELDESTDIYAGTVVNDASIGTETWQNPSNAEGNTPTTYANVGLSITSSHQLSEYLKATNFNFSIPSAATITGVTVTARINSAEVETVDNSIMLVKGGSILGTNNGSSGHSWGDTEGGKDAEWGSSADMWGLTLTPSDVNASDFGVALSCEHTDPDENGIPDFSTGLVWWIRISVNYEMDASYKMQIKPYGKAWEDLAGSSSTDAWDGDYQEFSFTDFLESGDLTNNDLPVEFQILISTSESLRPVIKIAMLDIVFSIIGTSVTGETTNNLYDHNEYIQSGSHKLGNDPDTFSLALGVNPSDQVIFGGYIDSGYPGDIAILEFNMGIDAYIDTGTASVTFKAQIRPIGETVWKDVMSKTVTLTDSAKEVTNRADLISSDFTGWTSGLRLPFESRIVISATTGAHTWYFSVGETDNVIRAIGERD